MNNPDQRVELVKAFAKKEFPSCDTLNYAIAVERVTTAKKDVSDIGHFFPDFTCSDLRF